MNRAAILRAARRKTPVWLRVLVMAVVVVATIVIGPQLRELGRPLAIVVGFGIGVAMSAVIVVTRVIRNPLPPDGPSRS